MTFQASTSSDIPAPCSLRPLANENFLFYPTDLRAQYEVRLEEGLDTFVVVDGLPVVPEETKPKLLKFLLKKLNTVGRTSEDAIFMPVNESHKTEGLV